MGAESGGVNEGVIRPQTLSPLVRSRIIRRLRRPLPGSQMILVLLTQALAEALEPRNTPEPRAGSFDAGGFSRTVTGVARQAAKD